MLIVSHDRELLNGSVGSILHLAQGKLTLYSGGYDRFEEARREKQRLDLKLKKKQDDERRHIEAFIIRFKAKASKAAQAQSRVKALARMQPIAEQIEERVAPFLFANPAKALASPLIRLEGAAAGYVEDLPVLEDLDLRLDADDRIGLLGANGNGKSTFAKLIAGRLPPMAGRRYASDKIVVGYFAQHQMDDLPVGKTPYQHMLDLMPDATEAQRRTRLGTLGFGVDKADTRAENLSGGEKARLLFALATFHGAHLLILDEPTNHLDVDAREALVRALNDYEGAVILITHDRHLIEACADRLWIVRGGTVRSYDGDVDRYRAECLAERGADPNAPRAKPRGNGAGKSTASGGAAAGGGNARGAGAVEKGRRQGRGRGRAPVAADRHHRCRAGRQRAIRARCRPRPGARARARRACPCARGGGSRVARSERGVRGCGGDGDGASSVKVIWGRTAWPRRCRWPA